MILVVLHDDCEESLGGIYVFKLNGMPVSTPTCIGSATCRCRLRIILGEDAKTRKDLGLLLVAARVPSWFLLPVVLTME